MPAAKKPTAKKVTPKAASTFKPTPTATPRYVEPVAVKVAPATAPAADDSWQLATQFWFAQLWRTMLVVIPGTIGLQLLLVLVFRTFGGPELSNFQEMLMMALTLLLSVALQVAVLRYMLRKKSFKGFTFTLERSE